jgi:hypothetical protein
MPILKFNSIEPEKVKAISKVLIDDMEGIVQCPRDYFSIEVINSVFIMDEEYVSGSPRIEVSWFDRGQETQDRVAESITRHMSSIGYNEVTVIFVSLDRNKYYENGEHF